jgi:ABC-type branched-subunit amino acid transport system substrate-binding protein
MSHEILVGTHLDLSGPLAPWGQATRNGLRMGLEEANAAGGMNALRLRLIVEDDRYDPATAAAVVRKLVNEDRVFAILSPLGTPTVEASMGQALNRGVLHLFPLMADAQSYYPLHPLKFAVTPTYANDIAAALDYLIATKRVKKIGVLHEANAFGFGIFDGAQTALARHRMKPTLVVDFPADATSFGKEINKLKAAKVDAVVLGSVVQDTIAILRAARARGFRPVFLCSAACYAPEMTTLGGSLVEGLYAVADTPIPYRDDAGPKLRAWAASYQRKFGAPPTLQALQGYLNAKLFADAVRKTGAVLTQANFARTLEKMEPWTDARVGGLPVKFSAQDHLGVHAGFLARVQKGRWATLTAALDQAARPKEARGRVLPRP